MTKNEADLRADLERRGFRWNESWSAYLNGEIVAAICGGRIKYRLKTI